MTMKAVPVWPPWLLCISFLAVGLTPLVTSAAECDPIVATAVSVQGKVEVRRVNVTQWQPVSLNDIFCAGDRIRVGDRSRADIALANRAVLRLDQNTTITLGRVQRKQNFLVHHIKGATYFFSRATRVLEVRTAFVNADVEGTEGLIRVGNTQTENTILDEKVVAVNDEGTFSLTWGQSVVSEKGQTLT
ncbi:MAG: FecR domain-containing protein [Nitrospirales bacterium]|nr:FecR domain-containing protein [Nitrospirales bacterium]